MTEYYYHGTTVDRLPSILKLGLTPAAMRPDDVSFPDWTDSNYTYYTRNYGDAGDWAREIFNSHLGKAVTVIKNDSERQSYSKDISRGMPVILRIPKHSIHGVECDPNIYGHGKMSVYDCDQLRSESTVQPEDIQVAGVVVDTDAPYLHDRYVLSGEWIPVSDLDPSSWRAYTMLHHYEPTPEDRSHTYEPEYQNIGVVYGFSPAIMRAQKLMQRVREGEFE